MSHINFYSGSHIYYIKKGVKIAVPDHKGDLKPHEAAHVKAAIRKANQGRGPGEEGSR